MDTWAIVTGGGTGIGRALCIELANTYGMRVLAVGRRESVLRDTQALNPQRIEICPADVSSAEGRERIVQAISGKNLRFVVHNAAVLQPVKPLANVSLDEWRTHFAINVEGPLFLTQSLLPMLGKGSRILHISSGAAHHAYAGWGAYCTSKAALHMLYQVWNMELNARGIYVGSVRPGVVDTPMQDQVREASPEVFPSLNKFLQLKEEGKLFPPETVARFIGKLLIKTDDETFIAQEWDIREHGDQFND